MLDTQYTFSHLVDTELAQYVMGWIFVEPHVAKKDPPGDYDFVYTVGRYEPGGPYVYRRRRGSGDFDRWSPTGFDADALDVVKRLQAIPRHIVITMASTGEYVCVIYPVAGSPGEEAVDSGNQSTFRAAICGAAEEWVRMREGNT